MMELAYNEDLENEVGTTLVAAVIYREAVTLDLCRRLARVSVQRQGAEAAEQRYIYANQLAEDVINEMITREEAAPPRTRFSNKLPGHRRAAGNRPSDKPLTLEPEIWLCFAATASTTLSPSKR